MRAEEVERWFSADPNDLTTNCVVCGKPETVHMGDGGYDCLLRSSRWLIEQGVVVPGSAMRRQLGQAWPAEFKDRMVTGVELNSNQFGKYRRSWSRIYRPSSRAYQHETLLNSSCSSATTFAPTLCGG